MDHWPLGSHGHPAAHSTAAGQELDDHGLNVKDVTDHCAVQKAYQLREARAAGTWTEELEENWSHHIVRISYVILQKYMDWKTVEIMALGRYNVSVCTVLKTSEYQYFL